MERILLVLDEIEDAVLVAGTLGQRPAWRRRGMACLAAVVILALALLIH